MALITPNLFQSKTPDVGGIISKAYSPTASNIINKASTTPTSMGVKAVAPITPAVKPTLPTSQVQKPLSQMTVDEATKAGRLDEYNKLVAGYKPQTTTTVAPPAPKMPVVTTTTPDTTKEPASTPNVSDNLNTELIKKLGSSDINNNADYKKAQEAYSKAVQNLVDFRQKESQVIGGLENTGVPLGFVQGQQQVIRRQAAEQENALQNAINQQASQIGYAQTGQGLIQQALGTAAGYAQPQMQFGQLTNPQTGLPVSGGSYSSNPQLQNAVAQAVQLAQTAGPNDPNVQALLSTFGLPGQQAFTQAMQQVSGGTYNPAAMNASVAQNISQGTQYQGQAAELNKTLQQFDTIVPKITDFLRTSGINSSGAGWENRAMKTFITENMTPDNQLTVNTMFADLKTYAAQILGNSGLNPTEVSATVNSFDPSSLSPNQLENFTSNLRILGQSRLQPIQQTALSSFGSGATPYTGSMANTGGTMSYGTPNTVGQGFAGTTVGLLPGLTKVVGLGELANFAKGFFSK